MRLIKKRKSKQKMMSFRANDTEFNKIKIKAGMYTEGNISEWIIYASTKYKPASNEVE